MGLLDFFRRHTPAMSPTALRDTLIAAATTKDFTTLAALCQSNESAIRGAFADWLKVPDEIRENRDALVSYVEGLALVARMFQRSGDDTLFNLMSPTDGNPILEWQRDIATADRLLAEGHATDAANLLEGILAGLATGQGTAVDEFRPIVLGRVGMARYRAGDWRGGAEATRQALKLCQAAGDTEGVRTYRGNLDIIEQRGEVVTPDDVEGSVMNPGARRVSYEIRGGEAVPPAAETIHQQGRAAGARGDYKAALQAFTEAATLAPHWPYPIYDRAFTYLLLKDWDASLANYLQTITLAPRGFFIAFTAVDTLQREAAGEFPRAWFLAYSSLELITDPVERRKIVQQMIERQPGFAPGWLQWAKLVENRHARLEALERGLASSPDRETQGMLQLNKAMTIVNGDRESAVSLLRALVDDPESAASAEALALNALAQIAGSATTPDWSHGSGLPI